MNILLSLCKYIFCYILIFFFDTFNIVIFLKTLNCLDRIFNVLVLTTSPAVITSCPLLSIILPLKIAEEELSYFNPFKFLQVSIKTSILLK